MRTLLMSLGFLFANYCIHAQDTGILPTTTFAYHFERGWKIISKLEQRTALDEESALLSHELVDLAFYGSKQVGLNKVWNSGIQFRFEDQNLIPRFIQQLVIKESYFGWAFSHRITWDITKGEDSIYSNRLRYRFAGLVPLEGEQVDLLEWYTKWGIEVLSSFKASAMSFEHRYSFFVGMKFSSSLRAEIGPEWRIKIHLVESVKTNNLWIRLNLYKTF